VLLFLVGVLSTYGFDWNVTVHYDMLQYSAAAYCGESSIQSWSCGHCNDAGYLNVQSLLYDSGTNTFGYIGVQPAEEWIVVVFRGTEPTSLANWITDLSFAKTAPYPNCPGAQVHSGFLSAYNTISASMMSTVGALHNTFPSYQIYVSGHSLGAALSVLAAVDISQQLGVSVNVYNYGDPRVGNQVFSDFFADTVPNMWRVVNEADIVPHLPLKAMGFYHAPTEVWYTDAQYTVCRGGEDPNCSNSQIDLSIPDHVDYMGVLMGIGGC